MKAIKLLLVSAICMVAFCSCEGSVGGSGRGYTETSICGTWCLPEDGDVLWYWEVGKDGILNYYETHGGEPYPYLKDRYLYYYDNTDWELRMQGQYTFDTKTQTIFFSGFKMGTIDRISRNEAYLHSGILVEGYCYRLKGLKKIKSDD